MGTRHLLMVISKKQTKVAQYGQWDGYPSGQGVSILKFLFNVDLKEFQNRVDKLRFMNDNDYKELKAFYKSIGVKKNGGFDIKQNALIQKKYYHLSRGCSSDILPLIMGETIETEIYGEVKPQKISINYDVRFLEDESNFVNDSLFCEWAYVIDLDKKTFEVYKGFNKRPLGKTQRFYSVNQNKSEYGYYAVRLAKKYSLNNLPKERDFLTDLGDDE